MNRIVAITGGFGHLGSVVGQAFADAGWQVALLDRAVSPRYPQAGALSLGGVDLTDAAAARAAIDRASEHFGGLDALINVAGGFHWETLADGDVELLEDLVVAAVNQGLTKAREEAAKSIQSLAGGLPIPGLGGLLGGGS